MTVNDVVIDGSPHMLPPALKSLKSIVRILRYMRMHLLKQVSLIAMCIS